MYRSILFLSMVLMVQSGYAEDLWSINIPRLTEVALKEAYEQNPELAPGDLVEGNPLISFSCYRLYRLQASYCLGSIRFQVSSSSALIAASSPASDLWSINVDDIIDVALQAAYQQHPDIDPGDLALKSWMLLLLYCPRTGDTPIEALFKQCKSSIDFTISSSDMEEIKPLPSGYVCELWESREEVNTVVSIDGSVETKRQQNRRFGPTICPDKRPDPPQPYPRFHTAKRS